MKRFCIPVMLAALLAGCAAPAGPGGDPSQQGVYNDPTYPGPGVNLGVGIGSWGRHSGGGVGIGLGW
jgi:hypothetical protein